jgi:hypothetical protein
MSRSFLLLPALLVLLTSFAAAQQSTEMVRGEDGRMYHVTRQTINRTVPVTEYQTRQERVYRPQVTTNYQTYTTSQYTPVTEYRWVSRQRGLLNPFVQPYWTHQLEPFTRWENRPATVQMPTTRTDWVEEQRTVQVPVTTYKNVQEEQIHGVAVAAPTGSPTATGTTPLVASGSPSNLRWGGERLDGDPPRTASNPYAPTGSTYR